MEEAGKSQGQGQVGRYHLVERLAVGGMAEVFLACERGTHALDRLLVIKRILPHLAQNNEFVEMFLTEARLAARINHVNVVQIYELGEAGGFPFIAMEYVNGSTLKELTKAARKAETRLPLNVVVDLMAQGAAGAHAAHELVGADGKRVNLVHRDLSPHNLMVTDKGVVKLLDFGIAKAERGMDNTRTGMLKGKISYMSPEQCKQGKLDRRSDIYALGIVMWELLAGRKMFYGMTELATMQAIVSGDIKDIREYRPDTPDALVAVLAKAMAAAPEARYQTAAEMQAALVAAAAASNVPVDTDKTIRLVRTLLGEVHDARRITVNEALDKTLVTLSSMMPADSQDLARMANTTASQTHTRAHTQTSMGNAAATVSVGAAVGVMLSGAFLMIVVGAGWWFYGDQFAVTVEQPVLPPEQTFEGDPVRIVLAPTLGPAELTKDLEPLRRYLQTRIERNIELTVASTYEAASRSVRTGAIPFALLPYNTLVTTVRSAPELRVLATEVVDGSVASDGYLVVARTTKANDVSELIGSTICYTDTLSSTGYVLPRQYLADQGFDPDSDFQTHFSGDHQQVLRDVLAGTCAIGGTYAGNYSTATQSGIAVARLRILVPFTGSTPHDGWVAHPSADPVVRDALREALLAFDPQRDLGTERLGENKRVTGYVPSEEEWLRQTE